MVNAKFFNSLGVRRDVCYPVIGKHGEVDYVPAPIVDHEEACDESMVLRDVSIVIPVLEDYRVVNCIESIDETETEVVIVANGCSDRYITDITDRIGWRCSIVVVSGAGIGRAINAGVRFSDRRYVLLMDADCIFDRGAIRSLARGVLLAPFVRGRIRFSVGRVSTWLPAGARRLTEDAAFSRRVTAYSPPLLYDRSVIKQMGEVHFRDDLAWREDRDFELRRRESGIAVAFAPGGVIWHAPLSVKSDLRSVFYYGRSEGLGRELGCFPQERRFTRLRKTVRTFMHMVRFRRGFWYAAYQLVRRAVFTVGLRLPRRPTSG